MLTKSFLPVVALAAAVAARPGLKNVVYFMEWSIYARNFHMFDLDWSRITHVNYAFGKPNADGTVQLYDTWSATDKRYLDHGDSWNDVGNNVYGQFGLGNKMKRQYRHTKFGLSIGGWTLSGLFSGIASTEAGRRTFAKSAVEQMLHLGLDFIDIDWEYPVQGGNAIPHSPNDMKNFVALLQAIRDAFASLPFQAELSVASPAGPENYVHWDFPAVCGLVDHVNLMAYDLAGSWSEYTDYQNNLYADPSHPSGKQYSIDKAVQDYIAGGCASDKIVMGIPLYGRSFEGTAGLYQPFAPPTAGSWVSGGDGAGVWDYKILPRPGATEYYDAKVGAGYSYNPNTRVFTSYETPRSLATKIDYIKQYNLGGTMFWAGDADAAAGSARSLITQAYDAFGAANMALYANNINYPTSKYANIRNSSASATDTPAPWTGPTEAPTPSTPPTTTPAPETTPAPVATPSPRSPSSGACAGFTETCVWPVTSLPLGYSEADCNKFQGLFIWCP
uniref:Secreted protein n=1 Tax=Achlya hypogyna TaxID=1202772 RepID=A0A0A7CNQ2_ACHHY|nr:secreted protein [Achlya hypogyna]